MKVLWQNGIMLLALALSTLSAFAQPVNPNTTFRVVNVSASDVSGLNVRDFPAEASNLSNTRVVGHLSWQASGIITSGMVVRFPSGALWRHIRLGEIIGWVNARYLEAEASDQTDEQLPDKLLCGGTEPFWGLRISKSASTYDGVGLNNDAWVENEKLDFMASNQIAGRPTKTWAVTLKQKSASQYITSLISRSGEYCSDGMSDRDYPYQAIVLPGNIPVPMQGCCQRDISR